MASEVTNTPEDAEMVECDGEKVVTMMDVLQEQEEFEEDANAVLGASDEKNCTYSKGYIKRQAIYACLTCCPDAKLDATKRAGVCLACSLTCHENHELVELYTKRNFRCDCGNPKFSTQPCQYTVNKTDLNENNSYNQNFSGFYCICQRPYPDPESEVEDEMIQCIVCEDWLHASHLDAIVPPNNLYSEMICKGCMEKNEFLHDYSMYAISTENVDVMTINGVCSNNINKDEPNVLNKEESLSICMGVELSNKNDANTSESLKNNSHLSEQEAMESEEIKTPETDTIEEANLPIISAIEQTSVGISENNTINSATNIEVDKISATTITDHDQSKTEVSDNCNNSDKSSECKSTSSQANKDEKEPDTLLEHKKDEANLTENSVRNAEQQEEDRLLEDPEDETNKSVLEANNKSGNHDMAINNESAEINELSLKTTMQNNTDNPNELVNSESQNSSCQQDSINNTLPESESSAKEENIVLTEKELETSEIMSKPTTREIDEKLGANMGCSTKEIEINNSEHISEKRKLSTEECTDSEPKKKKIEGSSDATCVRPKRMQRVFKGATFWPSTFRLKLCTCGECTTMYNDLSVLFLIDPEDTVSAYENLGKAKTDGKPSSQYEKGLQALSSLDRIQQINALTEYNKLRDKLLDFLKSFKDKKEIVKEEDIKAFFAGMKPKREPDGVYFCR